MMTLTPELVIHTPDLDRGETVADEILAVEDSAMEAWRRGDPMPWIDISADEVTYIDPELGAPVVGRQVYADYLEPLRGKILYDGSEYVNPRVALIGDTAVLTYNYHSLRRDGSGTLRRTSFWNTTEVYHRDAGEWRIIHTHWSYIRHTLPDRLAVTIPVVMSEAESPTGAAAEIMRLETGAMERWRQGDPSGFLAISAPEVSYFDTGTPARLDGLDALEREYAKRIGTIHYDVMEFVEPRIQCHGDAAALFYRFFSTRLHPDGTIRSRTPWNCTEVFVRRGGAWQIVHTHWSFLCGRRAERGV